MSENNKPELITTDVEVVAPEPYDFEFIANAFGLIPYQALGLDGESDYRGAFNIGALINIEILEDGNVALTLHGGEEILMNSHQFAQIEKRLRSVIQAQQEALDKARLQGMLAGVPQGKRFRQ